MKINAYAKINLTLDVLSKREDGYHNLDSVMQTVSLHDTVFVTKAKEISVFCNNKSVTGKDNIAYTAANKFFVATGLQGGAKIRIKKRIPMAAGLGGGSSDAAAVIIALDKIYKTHLSRQKLIDIAKFVGADVPFLLFGGIARMGGIGEIIEPLEKMFPYYVLLIKAENKGSTGQMYSLIEKKEKSNALTQEFINSLSNGKTEQKYVGNDFLSVAPQDDLIARIKETFPICVSLSGSGPTVFALYENKKSVKNALKQLKKSGYSPIITKFCE